MSTNVDINVGQPDCIHLFTSLAVHHPNINFPIKKSGHKKPTYPKPMGIYIHTHTYMRECMGRVKGLKENKGLGSFVTTN
jgi:hypothetical protein